MIQNGCSIISNLVKDPINYYNNRTQEAQQSWEHRYPNQFILRRLTKWNMYVEVTQMITIWNQLTTFKRSKLKDKNMWSVIVDLSQQNNDDRRQSPVSVLAFTSMPEEENNLLYDSITQAFLDTLTDGKVDSGETFCFFFYHFLPSAILVITFLVIPS